LQSFSVGLVSPTAFPFQSQKSIGFSILCGQGMLFKLIDIVEAVEVLKQEIEDALFGGGALVPGSEQRHRRQAFGDAVAETLYFAYLE
jgi:hypothetical protein